MPGLREYQAKRQFDRTPEPAGAEQEAPEGLPRFVVQEHHARRLHWDFRLERDGVLVSWALPKGVPEDPKRNNLAVHVEDHPLDYIDFAGQIPAGEYGAGSVTVWDSGTYETQKWRMDGPKREVQVTLHGKRVTGRYVLFQTQGENWMIHRMDPPQDPHQEPMPERVEPMLARLSDGLPARDGDYAYEFKWDGMRAVVFCRPGEIRLQSRTGEDITFRYPELRRLAEALGARTAVLDGEIVALDEAGVPRFEQLQQRIGLNAEPEIRRAMRTVPVIYMAFDLLYLEGRLTISLPYLERRRLLAELGLRGQHWQTPAHQVGGGGDMLDAARNNQLEGVMAKLTTSVYEEGKRSGAWLKVKVRRSQELVIGGWQEGEGRRAGLPGSLLVGYWEGDDFVYAGKVGTGFTEAMLHKLRTLMEPIEQPMPAFTRGKVPKARSHFVEPTLVAEFEFSEWTTAGQLRAPAFKGLRDDKDPRQVVRERPA
jgi:bifunctional non-homologous end joining protein LigD